MVSPIPGPQALTRGRGRRAQGCASAQCWGVGVWAYGHLGEMRPTAQQPQAGSTSDTRHLRPGPPPGITNTPHRPCPEEAPNLKRPQGPLSARAEQAKGEGWQERAADQLAWGAQGDSFGGLARQCALGLCVPWESRESLSLAVCLTDGETEAGSVTPFVLGPARLGARALGSPW